MYTKMCTFLLRRTYIISVRRRYDMKHIYMITEARVATGTHRNMDDMWRGDTGLGDALKAFEEFEKEVA